MWKLKRSKADPPKLVDKAKWHLEEVDELGLPEEHAGHHIAYFLRWLEERGLVSAWFREEKAEELAAIHEGRLSWPKFLMDFLVGCLTDEMVTAEGNAFGAAYYGERGRFWNDYGSAVSDGKQNILCVPFTEENYAKLRTVFDRRLGEWRADPASVVRPLTMHKMIEVSYFGLSAVLMFGGFLAVVAAVPLQLFLSPAASARLSYWGWAAVVAGLSIVLVPGLLLMFLDWKRKRNRRKRTTP